MATDFLFAQSEVVSKKMPEFFGTYGVMLPLIKKAADVEKVSERDFRAPFLLQKLGRGGTFNPNGGAMGRGTAPKGGVFTQTYFPIRMNYELNLLGVDATANPDLSRLNIFKTSMKAAIPELALLCDQLWHSDGTAALATATAQATVSGKTVYTMNSTTACRKLRVGQYVIVYASGLGAARDSGAARVIEQIDYSAKTVQLDATVTSAASTDVLCLDGSTGASPTGPNGLKYFHNASTSGTTLGVTRANTLEVVSNEVVVSGVPSFMKGQQLVDNMFERRKTLPTGAVWAASEKQRSNLKAQVQNIQNFDMSAKGKGYDTDLNPGAAKMDFDYCGFMGKIDPHQDNDRMDLVIPSDWGRVQLKDVGFYEVNGQRFFTLYGSDGSPASTLWFGLYVLENYICHNPGNGGFLSSLDLPTY